MPSKKEILDSLNKNTYSIAEVKSLINSVKTQLEGSSAVKPRTIIKGDVFIMQVGAKFRPHIVYKVREKLAYAIPMTTTDNEMTLRPSKISRFYNEGVENSFFSKGITVVPVALAQDNYAFHYEHKREIDIAIKQLRKLI